MANFNIGDIVVNFGAVCRVDSIDTERGLLVTILDNGGKQRFYANPEKCVRVRDFEAGRQMVLGGSTIDRFDEAAEEIMFPTVEE